MESNVITCSYPYGGNVPLNLARLHASVAHYCPRQDGYQVKVMCTSGCEEVAGLVRSITEDTRRQNPVREPHYTCRIYTKYCMLYRA